VTNSLGAFYDDWDRYLALCEHFREEPVYKRGPRDTAYPDWDHAKQLEKRRRDEK
jgi:hypothetical protein